MEISNEQIGFPLLGGVAIAGKNQPLAIAGEHRESIERSVGGDALQVASILADQIEIEVPSFGIGHVAGEDDMLAIGMPERSKVCRAVVGNLAHFAAIGVHHHQLHLGWPHQPFFQQCLVLSQLFPFRSAGAEDDFFPVPGVECPAIVARQVG